VSVCAPHQALLHAPLLQQYYLGGGHPRESCARSAKGPCLSCELVRKSAHAIFFLSFFAIYFQFFVIFCVHIGAGRAARQRTLALVSPTPARFRVVQHAGL
jgi:hypothetical protein